MSRTANTARNGFFASANFILKVLMTFIARTVFIKYLGEEYLGLNGLVSNILSFLALAELGISSSVAYALYKPVAENDIEKIKSFLELYRKICLIIAAVITAAGLALLPFLPALVKGDLPAGADIYIIYAVYLFNSVVSYFFAHRHILFLVYQRNDIESKINSVFLLLLNLAQIAGMILFRDYYVYIITMLAFNIINWSAIYFLSRKRFAEIRGAAAPLSKEDKQKLFSYTGAMFLHKIGSVAVFSTDNIIISSFIGLAVLGLYSNYTLVTAMLISFTALITTSFRGSIGNLIAEKPPEETYKVFSAFMFLMFWIGGFCLICLITLFQPFVALWLGEGYLIDGLSMALVSVNLYLTVIRSACLLFIDCAGLVKKWVLKPLIEAAVNLIASVLLVMWLGLSGVLIGTVISTVGVCLWIEPVVLYKYFYKRKFSGYALRALLYMLLTIVAGAATYFLCSLIPQGGILPFAAITAICAVLPNLLFFVLFRRSEDFKYLLSSAKRLFKRKT